MDFLLAGTQVLLIMEVQCRVIVQTICSLALVCPVWFSNFGGEKAFHDAFFMPDRRISLFICLPLGSLDKLAIKREIDKIGHE